MIDQETQQRLTISTDGDAGPYLMVPLDQLPAVVQELKQHGILHWVDRDAVQLDGRPVIAVVNFGLNVNPSQLQALLDAAG